jgi:heme exporter protein A
MPQLRPPRKGAGDKKHTMSHTIFPCAWRGFPGRAAWAMRWHEPRRFRPRLSSLRPARAGRAGFDLGGRRALVLRGPNGVGQVDAAAGDRGPVARGERADRARRHGAGQRSRRLGRADRLHGHLDAIKPQLSVGENLRFWAALLGAETGAVERALAAFGLAAHRRSGGAGLLGRAEAPARARAADARAPAAVAARRADGVARRRDDPPLCRARAEHCAAGGLALIATHVDLGLPDAGVLTLAPPRPGASPPIRSSPGRA